MEVKIFQYLIKAMRNVTIKKIKGLNKNNNKIYLRRMLLQNIILYFNYDISNIIINIIIIIKRYTFKY